MLPERGDLGRWPLLYLYYLAASRMQTGRLALRLSDRIVTLDFRKGAPVGVTSSHPDDALIPFLVRSGALAPERLAQARASNPGFDQGDVASALIASGLIDPQQLYGHLIHRAHTLLLGCMVTDGAFAFGPLPAESHQAFPLGDRWGLLTALVRLVPAMGLRHRLGPVWTRPLMKTGGNVALTELKLNPQETRALSRIDGVRSLAQLTAEHPAEADALMRLAFLLRHLEAVTFLNAPAVGAQTGVPPSSETSASGAAPRPPRSPPAPAPGAPPGPRTTTQVPPQGAPAARSAASAGARPQAPQPEHAGLKSAVPERAGLKSAVPERAGLKSAVPERAGLKSAVPERAGMRSAVPERAGGRGETLEELRALRARLYSEDHFKRLGIAEDAPIGAAKIAYFKLARLHHPDTVAHDAPAEMKTLKADIFAAVGEAYRVLSDEGARADYLAELASGGEIDVQTILQAEELFSRAVLMVKNRRFVDALNFLDEAISLNPEEGEFYAWRGWSRFCSQSVRGKVPPEVARDLDEAVKRSPRCVAAHHYRGSIARLVGDLAGAKVHLERVLELQPDHVEASRELRILASKR